VFPIRLLSILPLLVAGALVAALPASGEEPRQPGNTMVAAAEEGRVPLPSLAKAKGEQCVEPTEDMRRNHMKYLLHHRDRTMHEGIRTKQHSLKGCIECHAVPGPDDQPVSIKSRDHFCSGCHSYAAVKIDCWECHASQPEAVVRAAHRSASMHPVGNRHE
jgi:hypothetical protein